MSGEELAPPSKKPKFEGTGETTSSSIDSTKPTVASLLRKEDYQLSKFYKWTPQDDLLLKNAAEKGLDASEIVDQVKFLNNYTPEEVLERWKVLLYDNATAKQAAKNFLILEKSGLKRVPWTEEENAIILDELKKKGFIGFQQILDKYRDQFHPCRTVKSLEAHFYRLKRTGALDDIDHYHGLVKNVPSTQKQTLSEAEEDIFNEPVEDIPEDESITKSRRHKEKRDSKAATKLEKELAQDRYLPKKKKKKSNASKPREEQQPPVAQTSLQEINDDQEYDSYIFAILEGSKSFQKITKEETLIGRQSQNNKVDIDLSLEGDAGKVSRKQAILRIVPVPSNEILTTVATGTDDQHKKQIKTVSKPGRAYEAQFQLQNVGKRDILVDGVAIKSQSQTILRGDSCSLVFPGNLHFTLKINRNDVNVWLADYEMVTRIQNTSQ